MKQKVFEGGNCRKCGEIGLIREEIKNHNPKASYWFLEKLSCKYCKETYMINSSKVYEYPGKKQSLF